MNVPWTLEELLPHRPPMLLIDAVEEFDAEAKSLTARFLFRTCVRRADAISASLPFILSLTILGSPLLCFSFAVSEYNGRRRKVNRPAVISRCARR